MVSYEAKELLTIKKICEKKELTMFHKSMNMNRKGAASLLTNLFVVHWGVDGMLLRVFADGSKWLGVEIIFRETFKRERGA